MAPKLKKHAKTEAPKNGKAAKSAGKPEKAEKKAKGKGAGKDVTESEELQAAPSADELEEQEENAEAARHAGSGGNAAALAAAAGGQTESASFKNFRHHPDMENFYRFIYENDLRHEALAIIDTMMLDKLARRQAKSGKSAH